MVLSLVPVAFAQDREDIFDREVSEREYKRDNQAPFIVKEIEIDNEKAREIVKEAREKREESFEEAREKREERFDAAKHRVRVKAKSLLEAKERAKLAREKYQENKGRAVAARQKVRDCDPQVQDCEALKDRFMDHYKNSLLNAIEHLGDVLDQFEQRITNAEGLSEEERNRALAEIDGLHDELQELASQVDGLSADTPRNSIKSTVKDVRRTIKKISSELRHTTNVLTANRFAGVLKTIDQTEKKLERVLAWADEKGISVEGLDALIADFNVYLDEARAAFDEVKAARASNDKEGFKEALTDAKESLKEAHSVLRDIMHVIKQNNLEEGLEAEEVEEVEEEELEAEYIEPSSETQALIDQLIASFEGVEGRFELEFEAEKKDNELETEEEVEGELTEEQQALWESIMQHVIADVMAAEGNAELEIEIEHELEVEDEDELEIDDDADTNSTEE